MGQLEARPLGILVVVSTWPHPSEQSLFQPAEPWTVTLCAVQTPRLCAVQTLLCKGVLDSESPVATKHEEAMVPAGLLVTASQAGPVALTLPPAYRQCLRQHPGHLRVARAGTSVLCQPRERLLSHLWCFTGTCGDLLLSPVTVTPQGLPSPL